MDIEHRDTKKTPQKKKTKKPCGLVQNAKDKSKKKTVNVKGPTFEIQEYMFDSISKDYVNKYNSK